MVTAVPVRFGFLFLFLSFVCLSSNAFAYDGDASTAIFVDVNTGSDSNSGAIDQPLKSIETGIGKAVASSRRRVVVAKGTYVEPIDTASGVSVYGGYDRSTNWSYSAQNTTTIDGTVIFNDVAGETHFEGFNVIAPDAVAQDSSSYAVQVIDSAGPVFVQYNTLTSGHGSKGIDGIAGVAGASGLAGYGGFAGNIDTQGGGSGGMGGGAVCATGTGGTGGAGGYSQQNGAVGLTGTGNTNSGGVGGLWSNPGTAGSRGADGVNGAGGVSGLANTTVVGTASSDGNYQTPSVSLATDGTLGVSSGDGGGGGGGQHGFLTKDGTGDGGGGGGGSACGATAATSGHHGGGSFPVFITNSVATINANRLVIGGGGSGGAGGKGGAGGVGGSGGPGSQNGTSEVGAGGDGGKGGSGGSGGDGAGGNGGPGIGIFGTGAATVTLGTNRFVRPGLAAGGSVPASNSQAVGLTGVVQNGYPTNITDPAAPTISIADVSIPQSLTVTSRVLIRVSVGPIIDSTVTVNYQTFDGTAVAGTDYLSASNTLVFSPWAASAWIPITIIGHDSTPKTFSILLTSPSNATITNANATVTIDYDGDIIYRDSFD